MEISIVLPEFSAGGAERVLIRLANAWAKQGHSVSIFVLRKYGPLEKNVSDDVKLRVLSRVLCAPFWVNAFIGFFCLLIFFIRYKGNVLTSLTGTSILVACCHYVSRSKSRLIIREACSARNLRGSWKAYLARLFYKRADVVIAVSSDIKEELETFLPNEKVALIRNPVDVSYIQQMSTQESFIHLPKDRKLVVAVGRLCHQKGFDALIDGFQLVIKSKPEAMLVIIGDGEEKQFLLKKVSNNALDQDVRLIGFVENPYPIIKQACVVVCSSRWEGFPNVLLEAMVLQRKIVATNCPGVKGEFQSLSQNISIVPVDDVVSMAEAIVCSLDASFEPKYSDFLNAYSSYRSSSAYLALMT